MDRNGGKVSMSVAEAWKWVTRMGRNGLCEWTKIEGIESILKIIDIYWTKIQEKNEILHLFLCISDKYWNLYRFWDVIVIIFIYLYL